MVLQPDIPYPRLFVPHIRRPILFGTVKYSFILFFFPHVPISHIFSQGTRLYCDSPFNILLSTLCLRNHVKALDYVTREQRFSDSRIMFPGSSHSGYSDSQGIYTTGKFGFEGIRVQWFHFKFRIRDETGKFWFRIHVLCKRQNESGTKTFRIRYESENFCSGVNVVSVMRPWSAREQNIREL